MTFKDGKEEFKNSLDNAKEAATDAAQGIKKTGEAAADEVREIADGRDQ